MKRDKYQQNAKLILIANHIACQEDIPIRSKKNLEEADLVIFESQRIARQVLKYLQIKRQFIIFSEHQEEESLDLIINSWNQKKKTVYMSDQGCPSLEDPGKELVKLAMSYQVRIEVVPGPSSLTAALAACPFAAKSFIFAGFLPRKEDERLKRLQELKRKEELIFLMETPYRLSQTLNSCQKIFGDEHLGFLALEATSPQEKYILSSLKNLSKQFSQTKKEQFILALDKKEGGRKR